MKERRLGFWVNAIWGVLALMLFAGCSSPGESGSAAMGGGGAQGAEVSPTEVNDALDATMPAFGLDQAQAFYRLDLKLSSDAVDLERIELVDLPFVPTPSNSPQYMAVGWAEGAVASAVPVTFSTTLRTSSSEAGAIVHVQTEVDEPHVTVYLEAGAGLEQIQILALGGDVIFETEDLPPRKAKRTSGPLDNSSKQQGISREQLAFRYSHIHFLDPGHEAELQAELLTEPNTPGTGQIMAPSSVTDDVVADGLAHVAPGLLSSVSTIAVVQWPAGHPYAASVLGMALGTQLVLNYDLFTDKDEMVLTMVHEIAHNFTFLCNAGAGGKDFSLSDWPVDVGNAAKNLLQRFQLASGLDVVFQGLHDSGVPSGLSMDYTIDDKTWKTLSLGAAQDGGFASAYGSVNPWEDIAEYVGSVQAPASTTPGICPRFAGVSELPESLSIPYAKLVFLRGLGALDATSFQRCVGSVTVAHSPGIHFPQIEFTSEVKAGTLTLDDGGPGFGVYGKGPNTYEMLLEFPLPQKGATPLGIHRFDSVSIFNFADGGARVLVGHEENLRVRASERGMILVTEASHDRVTGLVFGLVLQNAAAVNTDFMPFGTFLAE